MDYEKEYKELKNKIRNRVDSFLLMGKILKRMKNGTKHWYFAYDFMDLHYKAPQRLSDLGMFYPKLIEKRKIGKFKVYRLKTKELPKWAVDN